MAVSEVGIVLLIEVKNSLRHVAAILKKYIFLVCYLRGTLLCGWLAVCEITNISPLLLLLLWHVLLRSV